MGLNLAKNVVHCEDSPSQFINSTPVGGFVMSCMTETQVCSLFKCLNDDKSPLDIPSWLTKIATEPLSVPNQSIETVWY